MVNTVSKITDFQHECKTWKRCLETMLRENAFLKNKLAELLKNNSNSDNVLLETAEQYQSLFLREDESINLLRRDVSELDKCLQREILDNAQIKGLINKLTRLRKDIKKAQQEFNKLKKQFNLYVSTPGS